MVCTAQLEFVLVSVFCLFCGEHCSSRTFAVLSFLVLDFQQVVVVFQHQKMTVVRWQPSDDGRLNQQTVLGGQGRPKHHADNPLLRLKVCVDDYGNARIVQCALKVSKVFRTLKYKNTKIVQHALKVSRIFRALKYENAEIVQCALKVS